jgi:hypothetical protein
VQLHCRKARLDIDRRVTLADDMRGFVVFAVGGTAGKQ